MSYKASFSGDIIVCDGIRKLLKKLPPNLDVCIVVDVPNSKGLSTRVTKEITGDAVVSRPRI